MLYHYLVKYCQPPQTQTEKFQFLWRYPRSIYTGKRQIRMEGIDHAVIESMAEKTEGFSGREIMKMVVAWHDAAFTTPDLLLTPEILDRILEKFQLQHQLKSTWTRSEALMYEKMIDIDSSMVGSQQEDAKSARDKESEDLLEKISGQRIALKDLREGTKQAASTEEAKKE